MSPLRIARIPYLNSAPFYQRLAGADYELVDMPPRRLGQLAAEGRVDAGILSLCDLRRNPEFDDLGDIGVSSDGASHSVLLFTRGPCADLAGCTIGITGETSTSFPLLRLVLEQHLGVTPASYRRRPAGAESDDAAALLIGDAALRAAAHGGLVPGLADYSGELIPLTRPTAGGWTHVVDLATAWRSWQGLPFVFARWAVGTHVAAPQRAELLARIDESLTASLGDLHTLAGRVSACAGLDAEAGEAYLAAFGYRFGERELGGERRFLECLGQADWWESDEVPETAEVGS